MKFIITATLFLMFCTAAFGQIKTMPTPLPKRERIMPEPRLPMIPDASSLPQKDASIVGQGTTADGKKVILKSDNTWEYEAPPIAQCSLMLVDAPAIRGLSVGMSEKDVARVFGAKDLQSIGPVFGEEIQDNGVSVLIFRENNLGRFSNFSGVDRLELNFFENHLYSIAVTYSPSTVNFSNDELENKLTESFNLPRNAWLRDQYGSDMQCRDFAISTYLGEIKVESLNIRKQIEAAEERKRNNFKP